MEPELNFKTRNIAITDVETTGLSAKDHEIVEIGLVLVRQPDFEIVEIFETKVKPSHIENAAPQALTINGYSEEVWKDAPSLGEALVQYLKRANGAVFCAHNASFDLSFLRQACRKCNVLPSFDYHVIDLPTLIWFKLRRTDIPRLKLGVVAEYLGIEPEPEVHRALNGAMTAYKILKKLSEE